MDIPVMNPEYNIIESYGNPTYLKITNTALYRFYARYLLHKIYSIFDWDIPESWNLENLQFCLCVFGFVGVMEWPELGVIYQRGSIAGHDIYYQPAFFRVANPYIDPKYQGLYRIASEYITNNINAQEPVINDCMLLKMTPDYWGIWDIISNYAAEMALVHEAVDINIIQSKDPKVFISGSKGAQAAFKKAMDKAISGEPVIVFDKEILGPDGKLNIEEFTKNLHDVYLSDKLLDALRTIENRFDSMVGINNTNVSKRANMTVAEVTANNNEIMALPQVWADNLQRSIKLIKDKYNVDLDIKLKEGSPADESDTNGYRPL